MMDIDSIREEYEEKVIKVLRGRQEEILQHYKRLRNSIEYQKEIGDRDEESYQKMMRKIENNEFSELHDLDVFVMEFKEAGVIDYRTQVLS